jgi:hypothetical protein
MHNNDVRQAQAFLEADAGGAAVSFHELQAAAANAPVKMKQQVPSGWIDRRHELHEAQESTGS